MDYPKWRFVVPNVDELITQIEVQLEMAEKKRDKSSAEIQAILALATGESRGATAEEQERINELFATGEKAKTEIADTKRSLENARRVKAEELEIAAANEERTPTNAASSRPAYDRVARVGQEERIYHRGNDPAGGKFIRDIARNFLDQSPDAQYRLSRHMQEERVERAEYLQRAAGDAGTGAFAGLVVPQYLTDMYAPATANLRPFADICNKHPLPANGMSVNISRITTATSVDLQSAELAAVDATSVDDTLLTESVQTAAGQQTLSRQAIDRGTGVEDVVMDDLFRRYASKLDSLLITQATTGLSAVAQAVTYTDTSPTAAELYPKILGASANVESALLTYGQATHAVMHSRRWHWLSSQLTAQWPFINSPNIPVQAGGTSNAVGYDRGVRGLLPNGLQVIVDNNIATNGGAGTNEDEVYVVPQNECHLWEDPNAPVFIRAEQPKAANLGVLLVLYGYFAYSFRRYTNGMGKVSGTGLVTPTF